MRSRWIHPLVLALVALVVAGAWAPFTSAQSMTTGRLSGRIVSEADGAALPGAQVQAVHLPTGTRYDALTRNDGRFDILNVRVGGPYTVTARMSGFVDTVRNEVFVALGEEENLQIPMPIETIQETVTVVGEQSPIINPSATGAASNVSVQTIEALPVVQRSIQEIAKLSPYFASYGDNGENTGVEGLLSGLGGKFSGDPIPLTPAGESVPLVTSRSGTVPHPSSGFACVHRRGPRC